MKEGNEISLKVRLRIVRRPIDKVEAGDDNAYKFGSELSPETKIKLIESGEIKPVVLFIDELNRTEQQTMKELMNIILNKSINGYDLPWFVSVVSAVNPCSQNSTYATNELDDAQLDRFLKIKVDANLEGMDWPCSWYKAQLRCNRRELQLQKQIFIKREKGQEDTSEMTPSPRSWEMVSNIYTYIKSAYKTKFFTDEERKKVMMTLEFSFVVRLVKMLQELFENINRKENNIKPAEILTMKENKIDPAIVTKFNNQKRLTQKIIADNVVNYVANVIRSRQDEDINRCKEEGAICKLHGAAQGILLMLDTAQILFVKKFLKLPNGQQVFNKISKAFTKEILANIYEAKAAIKDLSNDNRR